MKYIRCQRCGKLKEPNQFKQKYLLKIWCAWCASCINTPFGVIAK